MNVVSLKCGPLVACVSLFVASVVQAQTLTVIGSGGDYSQSGTTGSEMAIDPGNWLYVSSGMGGGGSLLRIDISDPSSIGAPVDISDGGFVAGIAVNPSNGRYATTSGYGGQVRIYNSDMTIYDTENIIGCGGSLDNGAGTFAISSQCTDRVHIYDEATGTITFIGSGAVGSSVFYNGATGDYYHNRTPGNTFYVNELTNANGSLSPDVQVLGANSVTNRLYGFGGDGTSGDFKILDGSSHAELVSFPAPSGHMAVDETLNRVYIGNGAGGTIDVRHGTTGALIEAFALGGGWVPHLLEMHPGSNTLFATARNPGNPGIDRIFAMTTTVPVQSLLTVIESGADYSQSGTTGSEMAIDPGNWLYVSSGMGGGGSLLRIDISDPTSIGAPVDISNGGFVAGIAVNPSNGRYATTSGYGGQVRIYNSDMTVFDTENIVGCGGSLDNGNGTFAISSQCTDRVHIYDEATGTITFIGSGGVGSSVFYNGATGDYYHNRTPGNTFFVNELTNVNGTLSPDVQVLGANSVTNRLYGFGGDGTSGDFKILDGSSHAELVSFPAPSGHMAVDESLNRVYVSNGSGGTIDIRDGTTGLLLEAFSLGGGWTPHLLEMPPGSHLLFATARNSSLPGMDRIFVMSTLTSTNADSYNVLLGTPKSGDLSDTLESDDSRLCTTTGHAFSPFLPSLILEFESTLVSDTPNSLSVRLESQVTDIGIDQAIQLYNFNTGSFETIDTRDATLNADQTVEISVAGDLTRFVQAGTAAVRTRVTYKSDGTGFGSTWDACIDELTWLAN